MPAARTDRQPTDRTPMADGAAMLPGAVRSALREAAAALDVAERYRHPLEMCLALAQVGRCHRALQAHAAAESYFAQALRWAHTLGAADQAVEILCLLAEAGCAQAEQLEADDPRRAHAALERMRDHAFDAARLAGRVADPQWEIKVLLRISDVLDRCGDHDDAIELQSRAMRLMYGAQELPDAADAGPAPAAGAER